LFIMAAPSIDAQNMRPNGMRHFIRPPQLEGNG